MDRPEKYFSKLNIHYRLHDGDMSIDGYSRGNADVFFRFGLPVGINEIMDEEKYVLEQFMAMMIFYNHTPQMVEFSGQE